MSTPPDPVFVLRGSNSSVTSLEFLGKLNFQDSIASGSQDGLIYIWSLQKKSVQETLSGHSNKSVLWLKKSCEENALWSMGRSSEVKLWDLTATLCKRSFPIKDYLGFSGCDIVDDNFDYLLASPGQTQEGVTLWDLRKETKIGTCIPSEARNYGTVMQVKFVKNQSSETYLLVLHESGHLLLWETKMLEIVDEIQISENTMCMDFNFSSFQGICGSAEDTVTMFLFSDNKLTKGREMIIKNPGISVCKTRPDGKLLATGGWDYRIRIFSWKTGKQLAVLQYHKKTVECLSYFKLNEKYLLAAGSRDQSISLWDIYN